MEMTFSAKRNTRQMKTPQGSCAADQIRQFGTRALGLFCGLAVLSTAILSQTQKAAAPAAQAKPGTAVQTIPTPTPAKPPGPINPPAVKEGPANDLSQMTSQQFRALPPTAQVSYNGHTMTKSAFIDQRRKELRAQAKSLQTQVNVQFQGAKAQFDQKQMIDLAARNARVKTVADSYDRRMQQLAVSPAYLALAKEASEIVRRYPSASPAEQLKLKQRATELHTQLSKMEQSAVTGH
jgi:hypothetical protein